MKSVIYTGFLAAGLAVTPAIAQQAQHPHGTNAPAGGQSGQSGMMQSGMMHEGMMKGGMMQPSKGMQAHQQKMQEMRALMQKAHATTDPAERQRLMAAHRQMMQTQMASMMKGDNATMMRACQERMGMMHDMMGQMAAEQDMVPAK